MHKIKVLSFFTEKSRDKYVSASFQLGITPLYFYPVFLFTIMSKLIGCSWVKKQFWVSLLKIPETSMFHYNFSWALFHSTCIFLFLLLIVQGDEDFRKKLSLRKKAAPSVASSRDHKTLLLSLSSLFFRVDETD